MKFKTVIAIALALMMLFAFAMPAFAKATRDRLDVKFGGEKGFARVVLTPNDSNQVWVEVTAKRLLPDTMYWLEISGSQQTAIYPVGGTSDPKGNWGGGALIGPFSGDAYFIIRLLRGSQTSSIGIGTEEIWMTFP